MKTRSCSSSRMPYCRRPNDRGGVLITALLIAIAIAIGLAGYLLLSRNSLALAHRTYFANDAVNLAEAGLEEALYSFQRMSAGAPLADAWTGWTLSGTNATRTLAPFNRDQQAVGIVKVFVRGYNGSDPAPIAISQATITPFDGTAPVVKICQVSLMQQGLFSTGVAGLNGLNLNGQPIFDSFNSNPTNSPTGPWLNYSSAIATSNTMVIVPNGTLDLGNGLIKGNLSIGPTVTPPPPDQVTGTINSTYVGTFKMPTYPSPASVSKSYNLGSKLPSTLPAKGDKPADDGRYYYFINGTTIGNLTIAADTNVTIVGTSTDLHSGLTVGTNANCAIYIDGEINAGTKNALNNSNWAGAMQLFTTTTQQCNISGNGELRASVYAPYAPLKANGGGTSGSVVGSYIAQSITATGQMSFHYDEALKLLKIGGGPLWDMVLWYELQSQDDRASVGALTNNFLP